MLQDFPDFRDDVLAVDVDVRVLGLAQRGVKDGPVFGLVDLFPGEHGVDLIPEIGFLAKLEERLKNLVVDEVLGVVEVPVPRFGGVSLCSIGVGFEKFFKFGEPFFFQGLQFFCGLVLRKQHFGSLIH